MSSELEKTAKDKNPKQSAKSIMETTKPNLRNRSTLSNNFNYRVTVPKKNMVKPLIVTNKDKTPIKMKQTDEPLKKIATDFIVDEKQLTEVRKEKPNYLLKDESPWTKFCKSDLSPLCKTNNLFSPNRQVVQENESFSQAKMTNRLIEYQTPSPSLLKKGEFMDFSPFLNYTAKKVIQKLDFSNLEDKKTKTPGAPNSVIVCFKSPTFNFLNKKYELEEDFIFSTKPKASLEKIESSSDPGEDDIIKLVSKGPPVKEIPQTNNDLKQKQESFLKTMNKYKDVDLEGNIPTIKKITPFVATNEQKNEELNPKNLSLHSFYSMPKGINNLKVNFRSPQEVENAEFSSQFNKNPEKKNENNEENLNLNPEQESSFQMPKKVTCNCKKSRCLKLYCDCFAASEFCSKDCNCLNCANVVENEEERYSSMVALMERNPLAFKPKYDKKEEIDEKNILVNENNDKIRHAKGCNCKKSNCLKKYCECYQAGIKCTDLCKCDTCKNHDGVGFMKKRRCNPLVENFNQYSEGKQEVGPNSFTFGYSQVFDAPRQKKTAMEEMEEEESNESSRSFSQAKNFRGREGGYYQTPKAKVEHLDIRKEKVK